MNVLCTTPLWVVNSRLTIQSKNPNPNMKPYKGMIDGLIRVGKEEGLASLWSGVGPSIILVSNPTIHFVVYEKLRELMLRRVKIRGYKITPIEFFIMGALAKMVATILTFPLQIAQSRLRTSRAAKPSSSSSSPSSSSSSSSSPSPPVYTGTLDVLRKLYQKEGISGWFRGIDAKLWQTMLTAAFQFAVYEQIQQVIFALFIPKKTPQPPTMPGQGEGMEGGEGGEGEVVDTGVSGEGSVVNPVGGGEKEE